MSAPEFAVYEFIANSTTLLTSVDIFLLSLEAISTEKMINLNFDGISDELVKGMLHDGGRFVLMSLSDGQWEFHCIVQGTLGIFSMKREDAIEYAHDLGKAMGVTDTIFSQTEEGHHIEPK